MGRQVFGCDICQDVCPWNDKLRSSKTPIAIKQGSAPRPELINPDLGWLAKLDNAAFKRLFKGSPLERTGRKRLHRNVAIAMGNTREPQFLPQLELWTQAEDPVLAEAAAWAMRQIRSAAADLSQGPS
jgi:epoxyqueuosine reductase